jgi:DNA-binding transcriptional ArsR family regulator
MSIQAVAFVLDTHVPEVAAKMLLVCLANAHNQSTGLCCPSVARLADESSMSRRSVQRWLKWLAENGIIEIVEKADESGRQQANEYRIVGFARGAKLTPSPKVDRTQAVTLGGDTADALVGVTGDIPLKEPEEYRKNEREHERASFDETWDIYPQRPGANRTEARREHDRLSNAETIRLYTAVQRFAQWHIEDAAARNVSPESQLQFRPGMGKWIRTGAWVDALHISLKSDPVPPAANGLIVLKPDHPDFLAVQKMRGRPVIVGKSGTSTFRIEEIEQARASA